MQENSEKNSPNTRQISLRPKPFNTIQSVDHDSDYADDQHKPTED